MDFYKSEETYLAHYGVMGMKLGVRKSIRKLNSYGNRSSRYGKKIQKKIKKYNKLMAKSYKFKSKGKLAESFEKESKAFKTSRKATKLVKKQDKNLKRYEETRKYIEKSFSTSLKKINKGKIDKSTPYNIGQLMSVKIKSIPKVTYNIKK